MPDWYNKRQYFKWIQIYTSLDTVWIHYEYYGGYVCLHLEGEYTGKKYARQVRELKLSVKEFESEIKWLAPDSDCISCIIREEVNGTKDLIAKLVRIVEIFDENIVNIFSKNTTFRELKGVYDVATPEYRSLSEERVSIQNMGITDVFDLPLSIPDYQRIYCWENKQIESLWESLKEIHPNSPYHLGTLILQDRNGSYEIVDGQQRLVTLSLILWGLGHTGNIPLLNQRFKDSDAIKHVRNCKAVLTTLIRDLRSNQLLDTILKSLKFSVIVIKGNNLDLAYTFFSNANSKGVKLSDYDLLKAHHLRYISSEPQARHLANSWSKLTQKKEDVGLYAYSKEYESLFNLGTKDALYKILDYDSSSLTERTSGSYPTIAEIDVKAEDFNNPFSDNNERSVITFPEFLLLTLDIYKNKEGDWSFYKTDKLTEIFSESLTKNDVQGFYERLLKLRIALDYFVIRRKVDGLDSRYSLTYHNENESVSHDCLMQYEAMLYVSTPYYKWVKELLKFLNDGDKHKSTESILSHLKKWDNNQHSHPVAKDKMTYDTIDRYWFWRLDYYLWEHEILPKETEDESGVLISYPKEYHQSVLDYVFRANRSIEHLHPQNQSNNDEWSRRDIDSFGNLAMISQSFNSQQSNEDVHVKFSRVESQVRNKALQSLKLLRMYLDAKGNPDGWTNETAQKHGEIMIGFLNSTFLID